MALAVGWFPPVSPYGLIQESLWPNEWLILIVCVLLNCTARKQVDRVLPNLIVRWPDARSMANAHCGELSAVIASLGFGNRRADTLIQLSKDYLGSGWSDARELSGVGEYAGRAWDIFCRGVLGDSPPQDHALVEYWEWITHAK